MQQSLNDDMDELFRKAAEEYPLKTDGANWDKVLEQLRLPGDDAGTIPYGPTPKKRRWLFLLWPLLCIGVLGYWLLAGKHHSSSTAKQESSQTVKPATKAPSAPGVPKGTAATTPTGALTHTATGSKTGKQEEAGQPLRRAMAPAAGSNPPGAAMRQQAEVNNSAGNYAGRQGQQVAETPGVPPASTPPAGSAGNQAMKTGGEPADSVWLFVAITRDSLLMIVPLGNTLPVPGNPVQPIPDAMAGSQQAVPVVQGGTKKANVKKGLYVGMMVAPDLSTVKLQRVQDVGYGAGIVAGYRLSRRLAVELGIFLDKKYYYSKGTYFSTKKIPIPSYAKIKKVDGWCNMIELPVNVRYFFKQKEKSSWFVSAGLSSYLMNKESYDYTIEQYGNTYDNNWAYKNASKDWFSIMQAGIGYERNIGVLGVLRIEPYVKLPLKGVGIGSLPISSVGMNIGITKSIR
jgi:hypothetical protein